MAQREIIYRRPHNRQLDAMHLATFDYRACFGQLEYGNINIIILILVKQIKTDWDHIVLCWFTYK